MKLTQTLVLLSAVALVFATASRLAAQSTSGEPDALAKWSANIKVHPVSDRPGRHTIHMYYLCNPESPDGGRVVFYSSKLPSGYAGEICMLDRASGVETVLVENVHVEDAHRAACQQWISGGKLVAFHDVRDGHWQVIVVDVNTRQQRVLATDRQLAFAQPTADLLPIYGCHWNPGEHRNLELVNVVSGEITTPLTAAAVEQKYNGWLKKEFGDKQISIAFPALSPDLKRVFIKISAGNGGNNYMSKAASHRQGLIEYDLEHGKFLLQRNTWGHPGWHPDSRHILEVGNILIDGNDGATTRIPNEPSLRGSHPSVGPDGKLFVTDGFADSVGGKPGEWCILVGDMRGGRYHVLHTFDNTHGAKSWRRNDPHPAFSADGNRIYFNVSSGDWTQLYVAEAGAK